MAPHLHPRAPPPGRRKFCRSLGRGPRPPADILAAVPGTPLLFSLAALFFAPVQATPRACKDCPPAACERPVRIFRDGRAIGTRCPDEGLTVLDLGDAWIPYPFAGAALDVGVAPPSYRDTLVALAGGAQDLELYGVSPAPQVVLTAMSDEARHRCHDAIDDAPLAATERLPRREDPARASARREDARRLAGRLEATLRRQGLADAAALAQLGPGPARLVAQVQQAADLAAALDVLQAHLLCDGLLVRRSGAFDAATAQGLAAFQRRHWIVGRGELDDDTRAALLAGSRELDFRLALRLLRQRVADAAGLIEDGSARGVWRTVLGRQLDPEALRYRGALAPLEEGAEDLIAPATEAAARALGWTDFAAARDGLREVLGGETRLVAVPSPSVPAYHQRMLELRATIDRPASGERPMLTLYARAGDRDIALIRWPTTVGGWKSEKLPGGAIVRKYKHSDVGPRVWRDMVAAPVWYAPDTTPDRELLGLQSGHWTVKEELLGPGPRSAYGLVMLVHHEPVALRTRTALLDHGIRTHGSVSYRSILSGDSHGCHRLYNHHALRLATFILRHRIYVAHGPIQEHYDRGVRGHGRSWSIHRESRGFRYELTPPVPLEVGRGVLARPKGKT